MDASFKGKQDITFRLVDSYYYSRDVERIIGFIETDRVSPEIRLINPPDGDTNINIYRDQFFNLRAQIVDSSPLRSVNIYLDNKLFKVLGSTRAITVPINE